MLGMPLIKNVKYKIMDYKELFKLKVSLEKLNITSLLITIILLLTMKTEERMKYLLKINNS